MKAETTIIHLLLLLCLCSCEQQKKDDYKDNTPTSGKLKVYYEEGLHPHVLNQVYTFEALYGNVEIETRMSSEQDALSALLADSCEAIVISRLPGKHELQAFSARQYTPDFSAVAKSGIAFIANAEFPLDELDSASIHALMLGDGQLPMPDGTRAQVKVLFDRNNSSVMHYVKDSILKAPRFSENCNAMKGTPETINYAAVNKRTVCVIDYAWLSDTDDSLYKANSKKIKFLAIRKTRSSAPVYPSQSSLKLATYPFVRTVYVIRKTGEFSLAKGFESFVAGPKGQVTFLKQGLLPTRQQERSVHVTIEQ